MSNYTDVVQLARSIARSGADLVEQLQLPVIRPDRSRKVVTVPTTQTVEQVSVPDRKAANHAEALARASAYPAIRYMGSKARLLPWIHGVLADLDFETALDAFSGSGIVAYLLKAMGKTVTANDFLLFPSVIAGATVENATAVLTERDVDRLVAPATDRQRLVEETFDGLFYTHDDLVFLDTVWANLHRMRSSPKRTMALAALIRSCAKRQPRGVFTVSDPTRYLDGRRDLKLSLAEHFVEQVDAYNAVVFDSGRPCKAIRSDILGDELLAGSADFDVVYMDPPYVPRSDDNCYVKRYHFLEGLASYWGDEDASPQSNSKVRKIAKRYTPFSYRRTAISAFDSMFKRYKDSALVLSYSSNGYPDLDVLVDLMTRYKCSVEVFEHDHRYHFGTHGRVSQDRTTVREYLLVGLG